MDMAVQLPAMQKLGDQIGVNLSSTLPRGKETRGE